MAGPSSHFPIHSMSKRQDAIASSTLDADIVAADTVVRTMLIPCLDMREVRLQRWNKGMRGIRRADNDAAFWVMQPGRNPHYETFA